MKESSFPYEPLPAYSERLPIPPPSQVSSSPFSSLLQSVNQTRTSNIRNLVATHIHPHLHASAGSGLSTTTLLLIPSNTSSLQPRPFSPSNLVSSDAESQTPDTFPGESIIGFGSAENLSLIRLHGAENTLEFWRQEVVIRELDVQLKDELRKGGHRIVGDLEKEAAGAGGVEGSSEGRREAIARKDSSRGAEWKFTKAKAVGRGEVEVSVEFREICLRVENEMGLYETRGGKGIVVRVEFGG